MKKKFWIKAVAYVILFTCLQTGLAYFFDNFGTLADMAFYIAMSFSFGMREGYSVRKEIEFENNEVLNPS